MDSTSKHPLDCADHRHSPHWHVNYPLIQCVGRVRRTVLPHLYGVGAVRHGLLPLPDCDFW